MGRCRKQKVQDFPLKLSIFSDSDVKFLQNRQKGVWRVEDLSRDERSSRGNPSGYRVVKLDRVAAIKEVLEVRDPRTGQWDKVHVFYDTGSDISGGTPDLLKYDSYSNTNNYLRYAH